MKSSIQKSPIMFRATTGAANTHLDALRGVAALGVVLSHWRDCLFVDYADVRGHSKLLSLTYLYTGVGHQWVVVFFVLSGYLVGGSVLRQVAADQWSWRSYVFKRLTRLYTVLIPALVLGGLIDFAGVYLFGTAGIYGGHTGTHEIAGNVTSRLSLWIAAGNYSFLQEIYVPVLGTNGPLWSLSYEFWYYLAFPLLSCALWYKRSAARRIMGALMFAVVISVVGRDVALLGLVWLMGVGIHWLPTRRHSTLLSSRLWIGGSLAAGMVTIAACKAVHYHPRDLRHFVPSDLVLGVVVTLLVYSLVSHSEGDSLRIYTSLAQYAAKSSYTLYLVHVPALVFLTAWFGQARWQPDAKHWLMAMGILACVFLYAQVVYFCFEQNTDKLRRWLEGRLVIQAPAERRPVKQSSRVPAVMS
jgi:peptidoglycan/LPS O-acetylase OafA/YrhL